MMKLCGVLDAVSRTRHNQKSKARKGFPMLVEPLSLSHLRYNVSLYPR